MAEDFSHIIFPELASNPYRDRQQRVARTLNQVLAALDRERELAQKRASGRKSLLDGSEPPAQLDS